MSRFGNRESGFFGILTGGSAISGNPCGSFYDTTIQTATLINTAYAMKLNSYDSYATNQTQIINDSSGNATCIKVLETGVYNLQFSAQFQRLSGGTTETIDIWYRINETDDYANSHVSIQANQTYILPSWNWFIKLNANQFVQIMWSTTSTTIQLQYDAPSPPHPDTPSVIATINRVS